MAKKEKIKEALSKISDDIDTLEEKPAKSGRTYGDPIVNVDFD